MAPSRTLHGCATSTAVVAEATVVVVVVVVALAAVVVVLEGPALENNPNTPTLI